MSIAGTDSSLCQVQSPKYRQVGACRCHRMFGVPNLGPSDPKVLDHSPACDVLPAIDVQTVQIHSGRSA